jgi:4-hydroxy 2-oxovalerate aldolase
VKVFLPSKARLSAMVYAEGYSADLFPERSEKTVDMVRVIFWKRNLEEGVEYVRTLVKKGYEVGVQLARTDQYDLSEIGDIVKMFNEIHPTAVYLVDSFGTFDVAKLMKYAEIYDDALADDILFGIHAHNSLQQAFTNTVAMCEHKWKHDLILDASVMGMGRGAGNLNTELILNYLNSKSDKKYNVSPIIEVADKYIAKYMDVCPWGYSIHYFLTAITGRNPSFVNYMLEKNISATDMEKIFNEMLAEDDGIRFDTELCDRLIAKICK